MPELLHQQPVLTLALDSFQDTTIDESDIRRMWILFTKCKDDIKNGFRLENISWRIWYKKYLNNTSDLFSNNKIYHKTMNNSLVHTVDSNSSSFSTIEPIEVLKKCACGEQLISSSLNSLLTPHSEYTCFNKLGCHHHQNHSSSMDTNEKINENDSLSLSQNTLVPSSIIPEQPSTDSDNNSEKTVKIFKEEAEEKEEEEEKIVEEKIEEEEEENEENKITNEIPKEIPSEITHSEMNNKKEEAMTNCSNTDTTTTSTSTTTNDVGNNNYNTNLKENQNVPNHTPVSSIPPNCPTMEQFYQQQLLLLQQMYVQKQQQLQYQKQQMNVKPEQIYQQQLYLQQWYNQQQQQLLSNCSIYYKKYLQQYSQQVQAQAQKQAQAQAQTQIPSQAQQLKKESTNNDDDYDYDDDDDDDYDEDEDDDDFYYTDDDDEDYDDDDVDDYQDEIPVKEINEKDTKENKKEKEENDEDDLFKKVSTPTLKSKLNKSSLLSAMIKENNYNEYKKTIEIIQRYNEDVRDISYNIYSIKDYNHNCINSLNKNVHRKRAPSFEDLKNTQQGYRRLLGMHPLTTTTTTNNNQEQSQGIINSDIEEYYERNPHNNTNINGTNNSYSTVNTMSSQESHTTQYSGHYGCNGVYGSNKTTHSTKSTRSTISFLTHRTTTNNSISLYKNKKRLNYSN